MARGRYNALHYAELSTWKYVSDSFVFINKATIYNNLNTFLS